MQDLQEMPEQQPVTPTFPISEPLGSLANTESEPLSQEEADEIFLNAVSEIPTQPLPKLTTREETQAVLFLSLFVLSFLAGSFIALLTSPTVTIDLVPMSKRVSISTQLAIPTRTLAPVTLSKSLTATTTGHGHQNAKTATGTVTFYNGLFTPQTIPTGTVFTGQNGVKVSTDETVILPAGNPPTYGEATINAHALQPGAAGNIRAGDINTTVANGVLVRNLEAFTGGQNARDFQAVAQADIDTLTAKLQQQLTQEIPHQFLLRSGEALQTTNCIFKTTPNHQLGEEAREVTVNASKTCEGIAYSQDDLQQKATAAFSTTRPGKQYELVSSVRTTVMSVTPFIVHVSGQWTYVFTQDYEKYLAEQIQGDTPQEAKAYLLKTGVVSQVTVSQNLPDPYHIQFLVVVGL